MGDCVETQHFRMPALQGLQSRESISVCGNVYTSSSHCASGVDRCRRLNRNPECLREIDLLRIRGGLDALYLLPGNLHRLILRLSRMVLGRLTREKFGYCHIQRGKPLKITGSMMLGGAAGVPRHG